MLVVVVVAVLEVKVAGDRVTEAATAAGMVKVATAVGTMVTEDTITTAAVTVVTEVTITADMVVIILCLFVLLHKSRKSQISNLMSQGEVILYVIKSVLAIFGSLYYVFLKLIKKFHRRVEISPL